jgi:hypothetical protein
MLHPLRMKQRDLENPPYRRLSDLRQEKDAVLFQDSQSSSKVEEEKISKEFFDQSQVEELLRSSSPPPGSEGFSNPKEVKGGNMPTFIL